MAAGPLKCVLIVDDDPIHCELMTSFLKKRSGAQVLIAADGVGAKRLVESHRTGIDLVLCDLNMPNFDGVEYIMFMAEQQLRCALIIVSGADTKLVNAASKLASTLKLNFKGFMKKPVDFKQLDAMLADIAPPT